MSLQVSGNSSSKCRQCVGHRRQWTCSEMAFSDQPSPQPAPRSILKGGLRFQQLNERIHQIKAQQSTRQGHQVEQQQRASLLPEILPQSPQQELPRWQRACQELQLLQRVLQCAAQGKGAQGVHREGGVELWRGVTELSRECWASEQHELLSDFEQANGWHISSCMGQEWASSTYWTCQSFFSRERDHGMPREQGKLLDFKFSRFFAKFSYHRQNLQQ